MMEGKISDNLTLGLGVYLKLPHRGTSSRPIYLSTFGVIALGPQNAQYIKYFLAGAKKC